jgi:hypothetical protein
MYETRNRLVANKNGCYCRFIKEKIFMINKFTLFKPVHWIKIDSPISNVYSIERLGSKGMYIGTETGGLFFLDYNTHDWITLRNETARNTENIQINTISINSFDESNIFLGTGNSYGILESKDAGQRWKQICSPNGTEAPLNVFSICYAKNGTIYAGTNTGILISEDYCKTWNSYDESWKIVFFSIAEDNSGNIWMGTSNGVYLKRKNEDQLVHIGFTDVPVISIIPHKDSSIIFASGISKNLLLKKYDNQIFYSENKGRSWKNITSKSEKPVLAICSNSNGNILVSRIEKTGENYKNSLEYSNDEGMNWIDFDNGIYSPDIINCFSMDPSGYVYAGTTSGVYRSINPIMNGAIPGIKFQKRRKRRRIPVIIGSVLVLLFMMITLIPKLSPSLSSGIADGLRSVFGPALVGKLESFSFRTQDFFDRTYYNFFPNESNAASLGFNFLFPGRNNFNTNGSYFAEPDNPDLKSQSSNLYWESFGPLVSDRMVLAKSIVCPDSARSYVKVSIIKIDMSLLNIHVMPGMEHRDKVVDSSIMVDVGSIPEYHLSGLVAAFNGGFKEIHGNYGFMVNEKVIIPPQKNIATIGIYSDGSVKIGSWGKDISFSKDLVAFRQNCPLLIDKSQINKSVYKGLKREWGFTVDNADPTWRSGLGISKNSQYLIYAAGRALTAENLAMALKKADAYTAMQLDINPHWVCFVIYLPRYDEKFKYPVMAEKILEGSDCTNTVFLEPYERDFFYITKKYE